MAVPTFIGATNGTISSSSTGALPWVAGHQVDDLGICIEGTSDRAGGAAGTHTTPSGFTLAPASPSGFSTATTGTCVQVEVAYKIATSTSEANAGFTTDLGSQYGKHLLFRGTDTTTPIETDAVGINGTASTSHTITTGLTSSTNDGLVVLVIAFDTDTGAPDTAFISAQSNSNLTNVTKQNSNQWNTNSGLGLHIFTGELVTAGAVGDWSLTTTSTGTHAWWCGVLKSANPSGGGGSTMSGRLALLGVGI